MIKDLDVRELEYRIQVLEHRLGIDRKGLPAHGFNTPDLLERLESLERQVGIYPNYPDGLEEILNMLDDRTLQLVFREIDARDFALALLGMGHGTLLRIKKNFSQKAWSMMCDDVNVTIRYGVTDHILKLAKAKFLNVVHQLQNMGEIVVPAKDDEESKARMTKVNEHFRQWDLDKKEREANNQRLMVWKKEIFDSLDVVSKVS